MLKIRWRFRLRSVLLLVALLALFLYYIGIPIWQHYTLSPTQRSQRAIVARLEEPLDLAFGQPVALGHVLKDVKARAILNPPLLERFLDRLDARFRPSRPSPGSGIATIPFYVDPVGIQEAGATMSSQVTIVSKGGPLKTSLRQALRSLGMDYVVKDGLVTISSTRLIQAEAAGRRQESR